MEGRKRTQHERGHATLSAAQVPATESNRHPRMRASMRLPRTAHRMPPPQTFTPRTCPLTCARNSSVMTSMSYASYALARSIRPSSAESPCCAPTAASTSPTICSASACTSRSPSRSSDSCAAFHAGSASSSYQACASDSASRTDSSTRASRAQRTQPHTSASAPVEPAALASALAKPAVLASALAKSAALASALAKPAALASALVEPASLASALAKPAALASAEPWASASALVDPAASTGGAAPDSVPTAAAAAAEEAPAGPCAAGGSAPAAPAAAKRAAVSTPPSSRSAAWRTGRGAADPMPSALRVSGSPGTSVRAACTIIRSPMTDTLVLGTHECCSMPYSGHSPMKPDGACCRTCIAAASCCVSAHAHARTSDNRREGGMSGAPASRVPRDAQNLGSSVVSDDGSDTFT
eukprot:357233-Chlamydomonas_euryale.AAC.16